MTRPASLNPLIANLSAPPIPLVQGWGRAYDGRMGPLIDLSQAVPGYPPEKRMLDWLAEAAGSVAATGYGPIEGESALRAAYAEHQSALYGASIKAANIHITAGCNQAFVTAAMAVAGAGDAVLMTNPCYFNHETTLAMLGIEPRYVRCHAENGFLPAVEDVAAAIDEKVRALAIVTPNNPTGAVYPLALLAELLALCRDKGIWLILDETYRDFLSVADTRPHDLFAEPRWGDNLIGLYSFSKSFCIPGHRLGAVTGSPQIVEAIAKIMDNVQICAPRAPQIALTKAIPALIDWREENRIEIANRADALRTALDGVNGWTLDAVGAYFAFLRHPFDTVSSVDVAERLAREAGVITIPGSFFGSQNERHLRVAFANATAETLKELPARLAALGV
ncbi:aminotransferase [Aliihoeflea sp. PC F10.4]